jgi:hypothetical protein
LANEDEVHRLTRSWVHGSVPWADGGSFPFLFVNGGAAVLSGSVLGAAILRDTITQREIQLLKHTCICCLHFLQRFLMVALAVAGCRISVIVRPGSTRGYKCSHYFLICKGLSCLRYQVQHRDSGSWCKRHGQDLDRTEVIFPSPGLGES